MYPITNQVSNWKIYKMITLRLQSKLFSFQSHIYASQIVDVFKSQLRCNINR